MSDRGSGAAAAVSSVDVTARLRELARQAPGGAPVVSVYLNTRWSDEHQRERVRVFIKNETRKTTATAAGQLSADLAWIVEQGDRLVSQVLYPDADGVVMFAGGAPALRETIPLAVPVDNRFVVGDMPVLRPLVDALADAPRVIALFVDGERARVIVLSAGGRGEETVLESSDVVGHHRRGGFALLLQSRYQKHIHVHRARHFDAVASAITEMVEELGVCAIVLAGEPRNLAVFRGHLRPDVAERVVGNVAGAAYEPASVLADRAAELTRHTLEGDVAAMVDRVLVEAEGAGRAAAGLDPVLEAVTRGSVDRLYLLRSFDERGAVCGACDAVQRPPDRACRWCGKPTRAIDLGETMVARVIAADGAVESVRIHAGLARAGGVAALLRYAT